MGLSRVDAQEKSTAQEVTSGRSPEFDEYDAKLCPMCAHPQNSNCGRRSRQMLPTSGRNRVVEIE